MYQTCKLIVLFALFFDHSLDINPWNTRADHDGEDINNCLCLKRVLLQKQCFEIRQILLTLQAMNTLFLVLLNSVHLLPNSVLSWLHLCLFFVFVSLTEVFVNTLIEIIVINEKIIRIRSQKLTRNELFEHFTFKFLNDILSINSQNFLLNLLLQFIDTFFLGCLRSCFFYNSRAFYNLFFWVGDKAFDIIELLHISHHGSQSLSCVN